MSRHRGARFYNVVIYDRDGRRYSVDVNANTYAVAEIRALARVAREHPDASGLLVARSTFVRRGR